MAQKTQLVEETCAFPSSAQTIFNMQQKSDRIPIVLRPRPRLCLSTYYTVPSGISAITQRFGKDCDPQNSLADAGFYCVPACQAIAYCVTKQSCTYEGTVKACPTIDNVMVDCDLTLVFCIGPEAQRVRDFVYKLGAMRFNEFLAAATDEGIRQLVRGEKLENVLELRGSSQAGVRRVMDSLNAKFQAFGITFLRAVIKDVKLGKTLEKLLEQTTNFKTKIRDVEKEHEVEMKKITYDFNQKKTELERDYDRRLQDLEADMNVAMIDRQKMKVTAESQREVKCITADEARQVAMQKAAADLDVVKMQGKQQNEDLLAQIKAKAEAETIAIKRQCTVRIEESKNLIDAARDNADALTTQAEAEGKAASQLKDVREWELLMAKLEVQEAIARRSKVVISGANGDALLGSMLHDSIMGEISLPG